MYNELEGVRLVKVDKAFEIKYILKEIRLALNLEVSVKVLRQPH